MNPDAKEEYSKKLLMYREAKSKFKSSHKPAKCCHCNAEIEPGDDILVVPEQDKIYCCAECYAEDTGAYFLLFNAGDEAYASWFEKK